MFFLALLFGAEDGGAESGIEARPTGIAALFGAEDGDAEIRDWSSAGRRAVLFSAKDGGKESGIGAGPAG